jgi:hypothetical protein
MIALYKLRPDWESVAKTAIMKVVLSTKFTHVDTKKFC